jgi:2-amino-4-hydroxy-6-hydroxymethyldihydropteridine diphosphokinase
MSETGSTITVVGLGANLGDRLANLRGAVASLAAESMEILGKSHVYETPPAGGPPQPDYLNAAVKVVAPYGLEQVLACCLAIERRFGRIRPDRVRNGPRPLDLDILWAASGPFAAGDLVVPHPRLHLRPFALVPLLELMPDARDAEGRRYADLDAARATIRRLAPL